MAPVKPPPTLAGLRDAPLGHEQDPLFAMNDLEGIGDPNHLSPFESDMLMQRYRQREDARQSALSGTEAFLNGSIKSLGTVIPPSMSPGSNMAGFGEALNYNQGVLGKSVHLRTPTLAGLSPEPMDDSGIENAPEIRAAKAVSQNAKSPRANFYPNART